MFFHGARRDLHTKRSNVRTIVKMLGNEAVLSKSTYGNVATVQGTDRLPNAEGLWRTYIAG